MRAAIVSALLLTVSAHGVAQETTGVIRGRLRSSTGVSVAGARLTATSPDLLGERSAASAGDGVFQFLALPPGLYSVRVTAIGHRPAVIDRVRVRLGQLTGLLDGGHHCPVGLGDGGGRGGSGRGGA
jgi:hypothetical protein